MTKKKPTKNPRFTEAEALLVALNEWAEQHAVTHWRLEATKSYPGGGGPWGSHPWEHGDRQWVEGLRAKAKKRQPEWVRHIEGALATCSKACVALEAVLGFRKSLTTPIGLADVGAQLWTDAVDAEHRSDVERALTALKTQRDFLEQLRGQKLRGQDSISERTILVLELLSKTIDEPDGWRLHSQAFRAKPNMDDLVAVAVLAGLLTSKHLPAAFMAQKPSLKDARRSEADRMRSAVEVAKKLAGELETARAARCKARTSKTTR